MISSAKYRILVLMNGWSGQGISGGDKHIIDVVSYWKNQRDLHIMLSLPFFGKKFLEDNFSDEIKEFDLRVIPELFPIERLAQVWPILLYYGQRAISSVFSVLFYPRPDFTISSSHFFYDVVPSAILSLVYKSVPVVYIYHLVSFQRRAPSLRDSLSALGEKISLTFIRKFKFLVFCVNQETVSQLKSLGFLESQIFLTSLIIKPPVVRVLEKEFDICYLGRLVRRKGVYDLIKIISAIKRQRPRLKAAIVGSGEEEVGLRWLVEKGDLVDTVTFFGFVSEIRKEEILARSRIFVFPSYEEGWGVAVAEAMAYGLPVLAYDLPVYRLIFGEAPVLVTLGEWASLQSQALTILENAELYKSRSNLSRVAVERYSAEPVAWQELSVIERCVASKHT